MEDILRITIRSLAISSTATLLAATWSIPLAYLAAVRPRARVLAEASEGLVGVPTVLIGLIVYMLFSRRGPLGFLGLLYTPAAIVLGEAVLVTPLLVAVGYRVLQDAVQRYGELALSLGASEGEAMKLSLLEAAPGLLAALVMGFSRAVGELGVALLVGGNIKGYTRTLTTAIALEVSMGEYEAAVKLGLVLVAVMVSVALLLRAVKRLGD